MRSGIVICTSETRIDYSRTVIFCKIDRVDNGIRSEPSVFSGPQCHDFSVRIYAHDSYAIIHFCRNCSSDMSSMRMNMSHRIFIIVDIIISMDASSEIIPIFIITIIAIPHISRQVRMVVGDSHIYDRDNGSCDQTIGSGKDICRRISVYIG